MAHQTKHKWFIRIGLLIIGLAGLIFAAGDALIPQEGTMLMPKEDPEAFAELVTSTGFGYWALRGLIGAPMEVIGTIALFLAFLNTQYEKFALWGMLLCIVADLPGFSMFVLTYFIFPQVGKLMAAGHEHVIDIASMDAFMPVFGASFVLTAIGLILFAIAIWKTEIFPKWAGWFIVLGWLLLLVQTSYVIQLLANVVWGGAYLWMAISSWHQFDEPIETAVPERNNVS